MSRKFAKILNGSRLYGTHNDTSDYDYIHIYLPSFKNIILGNPDKFDCDISLDDDKHMSIFKFLKLLSQGQTVAIECLFAPLHMIEFYDNIDEFWWKTFRAHRSNLLNNGLTSMLGYCKAQAYKYCKKSENLKIYNEALDVVIKRSPYIPEARLKYILNDLLEINGVTQYISGKFNYIRIMGAEFIETTDMAQFQIHLERKISSYAARTKVAESTEGKDWKALSHALRVGLMLDELYTTKNIVFPLKYAELLKNVKQGCIEYSQVLKLIDTQLEKVQQYDLTKLNFDNNFVEKWLYDLIIAESQHE